MGKTTLAKIIAETTKPNFVEFSAVLAGIKEIKQVMADGGRRPRQYGTRARFCSSMRFTASTRRSRTRFCPTWSAGRIRLIGATTENPSFEIISALLSRCRVYVLQPLSEEQIVGLLRRALEDKERGLGATGADRGRRGAGDDCGYSSGDAAAPTTRWRWPRTLAMEARRHIASQTRSPPMPCSSAC